MLVPNLKEIEIRADSLHEFQNYFYIDVKKKNMKKIGQFSRANISGTTGTISIKYGMRGQVYVRHKIYKFGRNWISSF